MRQRDLAQIFLRKARDDLEALRLLAANDEIADWILGFHAQQAVEKGLKAVLTAAAVRTGKTHDLAVLIELLPEGSIEAPDWLTDVEQFRPFAVTPRYAELELEEPVDRQAAIALVERTLEWAGQRIQEAGST